MILNDLQELHSVKEVCPELQTSFGSDLSVFTFNLCAGAFNGPLEGQPKEGGENPTKRHLIAPKDFSPHIGVPRLLRVGSSGTS